MNYIYNSLPYDITRRIRQNVVSQDDANDTKDSFYVIQGNRKIEIRVSNHCTHLWTWHEHKNGKFDDVTRISIVFEDKDTYNDINLVLKKYRDTPLKVMEFVYRIENPQTFTSQDVKLVINQIKKCIKNGEMFADPTGKLTYFKERISINPTTPSNNKAHRN